MLRYSLTKTKHLVLSGQIRSIKDGGSRRILPEYVAEYVARKAQGQARWASAGTAKGPSTSRVKAGAGTSGVSGRTAPGTASTCAVRPMRRHGRTG